MDTLRVTELKISYLFMGLLGTFVIGYLQIVLFQNLIEELSILIDLVLDILNGTRVIGMQKGRQIRRELI